MTTQSDGEDRIDPIEGEVPETDPVDDEEITAPVDVVEPRIGEPETDHLFSVTCLTLEEAQRSRDLEWALGQHAEARPLLDDELGCAEREVIDGLQPIGGGGVISGAGPLGRGVVPPDETHPRYGVLRTICCFKKAFIVKSKPAFNSGRLLPRPGKTTPYVLVLSHCPADCIKANGAGLQDLLDNMRKALELMNRTALYRNGRSDQKAAIDCLKRRGRGLRGFKG